jgi:Nucleoside-diphosphate-sugar epimerases
MILVTGHLGHIGRVVCQWLDENDHSWVGYDLLEGDDIGDYDKLSGILSTWDINVVIHLAALKDPVGSFNQVDEYVKTNYADTIKLIDLCIEYGVTRFHFASTNSIRYNNQSPYTLTKGRVEDYLYSLFDNLDVVIYRFESFLDVTAGKPYRPNTHSLLDNLYRTYRGDQPEFVLYGDTTRNFMTAIDIDMMLKKSFTGAPCVDVFAEYPITISTSRFVDLFKETIGVVNVKYGDRRHWEGDQLLVNRNDNVQQCEQELITLLTTMANNIRNGIV